MICLNYNISAEQKHNGIETKFRTFCLFSLFVGSLCMVCAFGGNTEGKERRNFMNKSGRIKTVFALMLFVAVLFSAVALLFIPPADAEALSGPGSRSNEVRQIQRALKNQGFYNGSVDGIYGSLTESAVRQFQASKGLSVDGICGTDTLRALGIGGSGSSFRMGSSGSEVRKIQQKLKQWGYYDGDVDGIYGSGTESAVKRFQSKNGLTADGICGVQTLSALGLSSLSSSSHAVSSDNGNVYLLARIISAEARGESYRGQVAVGAVVLNRVESSQFPNTLAGVIYQKGAFTAIDDGQFDEPIAESAYRAAREALAGSDPTGGCLYYYNPATATSSWIFGLPVKMTIGKHRFSMGK